MKTAKPQPKLSLRAMGIHQPAQNVTRGAGVIRLIGGKWKRTPIPVLDVGGLRPTPDRVRETLFNWLGQDLTGWRCVDVFAGTGALGFEAASRGALHVLMCEQNKKITKHIQDLQRKLDAHQIQVKCGDGINALKGCAAASIDLIFIDPPFDSTLFLSALTAAAPALSAKGFIYLEAPSLWTDAMVQPLPLVVHRVLQAGAVQAHLLKRTT